MCVMSCGVGVLRYLYPCLYLPTPRTLRLCCLRLLLSTPPTLSLICLPLLPAAGVVGGRGSIIQDASPTDCLYTLVWSVEAGWWCWCRVEGTGVGPALTTATGPKPGECVRA